MFPNKNNILRLPKDNFVSKYQNAQNGSIFYVHVCVHAVKCVSNFAITIILLYCFYKI